MATGGPRAVGVRVPYADVPQEVRGWVDACLGPVEVVTAHRGGMSPGAAATLRATSGRKFFVKATGAELNEQTLNLFRSEIGVLGSLPPVPYRPALIDAYDDGRWVALLLEHVDGRYPDMDDHDEASAVEAVVLAQMAELTPPPGAVDVPHLTETASRWQQRWQQVRIEPSRYVPPWAAAMTDALATRIDRLVTRLPATTLCHFDVRDDNLLIKVDGTAAIFDWGMARLGPRWVDLALLAVQQPDSAAGDAMLEKHVGEDERESVTDFLLAFACSQAWNAQQPSPPSLPNMGAFCADDAGRMFGLAKPRLNRV